jgi:hypothetical protein
MMDAEVETVAVLAEAAGGNVIVAAAVFELAIGLPSTATAVVVVGAAILVADEAAASPKVNDWFGSAALHAAWSMTAPLTVKQVPGAFSGEKDCGPALPLKGKSWESVTVPPQSSSSAPSYVRYWNTILTTIRPASTRKEQYLISCSTTRIEVEASLRQCADHEHSAWLVDMLPSRNDIPELSVTPVTDTNLNWSQIGTEVSRQLINEEALSIGSLPMSSTSVL